MKNFSIKGNDLQILEINLNPQEEIIAEAGMLTYMQSGIKYEAKFSTGQNKGFWGSVTSGVKRLMVGESLFLTHFYNNSTENRKIGFAAPYPGQIIKIDLSQMPGNIIYAQKDSFLCAEKNIDIDIYFNKKIGTGLFGGEGFILESLKGQGVAFLNAGGTVIEKELNNDEIFIDTGCLVAFSEGIEFNIKLAGNLKTMIFGGEGIFLAHLKGSGKIWIQSMPFSRLADKIIQLAPNVGGSAQGEGSVLGNMVNIFKD